MAESTRNFSPLRVGTANKNERDRRGGGTAESLQNVTIKSSAHNQMSPYALGAAAKYTDQAPSNNPVTATASPKDITLDEKNRTLSQPMLSLGSNRYKFYGMGLNGGPPGTAGSKSRPLHAKKRGNFSLLNFQSNTSIE